MKLSDFDYKYPKELIAQRPLPRRDASRMMVINRKSRHVEHKSITDLPGFFHEGDLVVVNDSKVIPARLFGTKGSGQPIELLVVERFDNSMPYQRKYDPTIVRPYEIWRCLSKKAKRIRRGEKIFFGMHATATAKGHDGDFLLVEFKGRSFELATLHHGVPPLPPYIEREGYRAYTKEDRERYQTAYAKTPGSIAAPTAGLHLSNELLESLKGKGIQIVHITLHVGIDTFSPVRTEDISRHKMHGERVEISESAAEKIIKAKKEGHRTIAIGTTTIRALESAMQAHRNTGVTISAGSWTTDLFITPGYEFKVVDAMLTNFHQPKTTLLMLVTAFTGRELILSCYEQAIREKYRLFSYGDCMLIT